MEPALSTIPPTETPRLTQLSKSSGCGCKIAPAVLQEILKGNTSKEVKQHFPQLIIGNDTADDAAVYDLGNGQSLITTVDFFTPIVDDAYTFGQIAAANAISDVYAMGGNPIVATAILGWPVETLGTETASQVIAGARAKCAEANIPLAGGHSIESTEPFFGLSVNGLVKTAAIKTNAGAKPGDILFITKAIGIGVLATAIKRGLITPELYAVAVKQMTALNKLGATLQQIAGVHALTDVTGFGLLGHLLELCKAGGVSATIHYDKIPLIDSVKEYIAQFCFPDSTYKNWNSYGAYVEGINASNFVPLCDPQTNGGLLVAVAPTDVEVFIALAKEANIDGTCLQAIGYFSDMREPFVSIS